jgi:hypothetical protein
MLEKIRASSYKLRLPPVFNGALLTPYHQLLAEQTEKHPPPQIIGGKPEYEVEEILKHLNQVEDYSMSERTWEPR